MTLRLYQTDMDARLDAAFRVHRRVLAVAPTGSGKTVMFAHRAGAAPGRALILAHRRELIRQAHSKAIAAGLDASIYPSAQPGRVTVGSIQTLARRLDQLPLFARIIIDEAHHAVAGQYDALLKSQPQAEVEGWTASPERLDGRGLGEIFDVMVVGPSVAELTRDGFLVPARVYGPPAGAAPDLAGVRTMAGDFSAADLERVMAKPSLLGSAPEHYERLAAGRSAVVFCVSVKHAEESAAAFRAEGWRFVAVHGGMAERDRVFADFAAGKIQGLTSCSLIDEGLDIPDIGCVIDQAPTQSLGRALQRWGRGMRPAPGKADVVILDHAGNCLRHGRLPDTPQEWSLDAPKRAKGRTIAIRQCPDCYAVHPPAPRCPECGHDYEAARAEAERREIERADGELALLTPEDRRLKTTPLRELLKTARTHADLEAIGAARGFQPRWADIRSRFLPRPGAVADGGEFA